MKSSWTRVRKNADALHITIHDLRRYHNDKLRTHGLSNEESGALIGNSARVNALHYDVNSERRLQRQATEKRQAIGRISPVMSDVD